MKAWGIASVLLLAGAEAAEAGEWAIVSIKESGIAAIDVSTIQADVDLRTFWTLAGFPQRLSEGQYQFDYILTQVTMNCRQRTTQLKYAAGYIIEGDQIRPSQSAAFTDAATPVIPDTPDASVLSQVCGEEDFGSVRFETAPALMRAYRATD